jgi:hypothetical protein
MTDDDEPLEISVDASEASKSTASPDPVLYLEVAAFNGHAQTVPR